MRKGRDSNRRFIEDDSLISIQEPPANASVLYGKNNMDLQYCYE